MDLWGDWFKKEPCAVVGDNTASLSNLLKQSGKGAQLQVAKELAWRKAQRGWLISAGHIPTEGNTVPDVLSRLPEGAEFPRKELANALECELAPIRRFWRCTDDL